MDSNMLYLLFTKYATKLYPYDMGWKKIFKSIMKFYYFRKMRQELKSLVNSYDLYSLIADWLSLITYCKSTNRAEFEEYEEAISKTNKRNTYSCSIIESDDRRTIDAFDINLDYSKFSINIKNRKNSIKENAKAMQISITSHEEIYSPYPIGTNIVDKTTHFTVYNNGMVSSEYRDLYNYIEKIIREYIFYAIIHNLYFIIPRVIWREDTNDFR